MRRVERRVRIRAEIAIARAKTQRHRAIHAAAISHATSITFFMDAMLVGYAGQLKMPWVDAYGHNAKRQPLGWR